MSYSATDRDRYVMFQRKTVVIDDYGGEIATWADFAGEWVGISFGTGQERREAAQEAGSAPATFYALRNSLTASLSVTDRISYDGSFWDITSVVPSKERNVGVDVTAVRAAT
jgi:head-tail adaptor